ncbi:hypothetical protein FGIG_01832 [Fasciola gigantica]|uniref:Uncharacterized protein n=1 Tax=Fasciola gigantica TaxID=46835 RepID=A0A504Y744_FASGI|nr:hypothetical protein FGIG_01832 [Fasciola gigantica]
MGRKLKIIHNALFPTRPQQVSGLNKGFLVGLAVYARDYRSIKPTWATRGIRHHCGTKLYEVSVDDDLWVRHQNPIRCCHDKSQDRPHEQHIPLEILLDTSKLPTPELPTTNLDPDLLPRRWSDRPRRQVRQFQMDSQGPSYR